MTAEAASAFVPAPPPKGLGEGGLALWQGIAAVHDLDPAQVVQLAEACRAKDRLDKLDKILRCEVHVWSRLVYRIGEGDYVLQINKALDEANATANVMKQLLAALRLPDAAGKRPQQRGGARGAYGAQVPGGAPTKTETNVTAIERARQRRGA